MGTLFDLWMDEVIVTFIGSFDYSAAKCDATKNALQDDAASSPLVTSLTKLNQPDQAL